MMKVSVVMATYNGAGYIIEQLDSIRNQSYPIDEVIICDDRSTDNTVSIIEEYIDRHQLSARWTLYVNEKNMGYGHNFFHAADKSVGDIVFFADQDDIWLLNKVEIMVKLLETNPSWNLLSTDHKCFSDTGHSFSVPYRKRRRMRDDGTVELMRMNVRNFYLGALGCCMAVRREFLDSTSGYDSPEWAHDDKMWKLALCSENSAVLHQNLVLHRIHNNNTASKYEYHKRIQRSEHFFVNAKNARQVLSYLRDNCASDKNIVLVGRFIRMMELRGDLLKNRKIINAVTLMRFIPYYETPKSWLIDLYIALFR